MCQLCTLFTTQIFSVSELTVGSKDQIDTKLKITWIKLIVNKIYGRIIFLTWFFFFFFLKNLKIANIVFSNRN